MQEELPDTMPELKKLAKERGFHIPVDTKKETIKLILRGELQPFTKKDARESRKRIPLGRFRSKLSVDGYNIPADKVARWINDKPGRLIDAENGGYEFVEDPKAEVGEEPLSGRDSLGTKVSRIVGTHEDGSAMRAYLMVIDKDLYNEDQKEKQKRVDEIDRAIERGAIEGEPGQDGRYIPKGGIKIESNM